MSERCCVLFIEGRDYVCVCVCRWTEKRKKASSRAGLGFSDAPSVDRWRPLVYLSFYQSGNVPISLRDAAAGAAATNFALALLLFLLSLHRLFASTFVVDRNHSTRWRWHLSCKGHWLGPILSGRRHKKPRPRKGVTKKKEENGSFSLSLE